MAAPGVLYLKFTNSRTKQGQADSDLGKSYPRFSEYSKEADSNLWRAWVSRTQDFRGTSTGNIRSGRRECDLPKINHSWVSLTQERPSFGLSYPRFSGHPRNAKNRSSSAAAPG